MSSAAQRSSVRVACAFVLAAATLRPQLVAVAPLLPNMTRDLHLSYVTAGLLGALPVLCMGLAAPLPFWLREWVTSRALLTAGMGAIALFGTLRALSPDSLTVLLTTLGVGVGIAIAGASLPIMVKEEFPGQPLRATATYTTGLQVGAVASAALAIPLAAAFGGWRLALLAFSIATAGLLILVIGLTRHLRAGGRAGKSMIRVRIDRRTLASAGAFALFCFAYYGLTSWLPSAYVAFGWTAAASGILIALLNVGSLLGSFGTVFWARRWLSGGDGLALIAGAFAISVAGLVFVPLLGYPLAFISGVANGALLALMLALPVQISTDPRDAAVRSAVTIGVGYAVASAGPVTVGALRDVTTSFTIALSAVVASALALWIVCIGIAAHTRQSRPTHAVPGA